MSPRAGASAAVAALLLSAAPLAAQGGGATGSAGAIVLELPVTSRAVGLASAYASVVGDEGSVFANPAGMAPVHRLAVGGSWEQSSVGVTFASAAAVMRVGKLDFGFGAVLLDYSGDSVITPDPAHPAFGIAPGTTQALGVGAIAYRRGMLSVGASVKAIQDHIGSGSSAYNARGATGDLGFAIAVFDIMSFGAVFENLGGRLSSPHGRLPLPKANRIGFTLNFIDPQGTARLMTTTDYVMPGGGESWWAIGLEGGVVTGGVGLMARLGVKAGAPASNRQGVVYGGTVRFHSLNVDWSYQASDALGGAGQRIGVRWII